MNSQQIRDKFEFMTTRIREIGQENRGIEKAVVEQSVQMFHALMLSEIAAQLADLNDALPKLAKELRDEIMQLGEWPL